MTKSKAQHGNCCHCGGETKFAWVDTTAPGDNVIFVCVNCMNSAEVGSYCTPAYERVGQKTYEPLLKLANKRSAGIP